MQDYHGYHIAIFGVLMFGILQGVCVALADTVMVLKAGSSLDLPYNNPIDSYILVEWHFNNKIFAEYSTNKKYTLLPSQFSGRLKENYDRVGVTVQDLQHQDSGTFTVVSMGSKQYPTQTVKVYIESPITVVQIEKNQTWSVSTNSCDVHMKCAALRSEKVSYLWSGYKTGSGAQLQFSLSPAEGAVTLNCTAANNISSSYETETLSCSSEQHKPGAFIPDALTEYKWFALAGGAAVLLLCVVVISAWCLRSRKSGSAPQDLNTLYADVNVGHTTQKDKRSDSVINGMTVYETVEDFRVNPDMTVYAKVTLPQNKLTSATSPSPYQQVL